MHEILQLDVLINLCSRTSALRSKPGKCNYHVKIRSRSARNVAWNTAQKSFPKILAVKLLSKIFRGHGRSGGGACHSSSFYIRPHPEMPTKIPRPKVGLKILKPSPSPFLLLCPCAPPSPHRDYLQQSPQFITLYAYDLRKDWIFWKLMLLLRAFTDIPYEDFKALALGWINILWQCLSSRPTF